MRPAHIVVNRTAELRIPDPKTGVILAARASTLCQHHLLANGATVEERYVAQLRPTQYGTRLRVLGTVLSSEFCREGHLRVRDRRECFAQGDGHHPQARCQEQPHPDCLQIPDEQGNVLRLYNLPSVRTSSQVI